MTNKQRTNVRKSPVDARTQRTTSAVAHALIQLIQESGSFEDITVRQILQRAGVGRTAFYSHFRSKEDVLHSTYEAVFGTHKEQLRRDTGAQLRLFPVSEFLEHLAGAKPLIAAFRKAGLADDMKWQFTAYAADIIEWRVRDLDLSMTVQPRLAARMLAAALIESIDWWVDHQSISAAEIETAFQLLARTVIANSAHLRTLHFQSARQ